MKLELDRLNIVNLPTQVIMDHNGQRLTWNIALFDKTSYNGNFDIFAEINGYWAYLAPKVQDEIFKVYEKIHALFHSVFDSTELTRQLYVLVAELYKYHELEDVETWLKFYSSVVVPTGSFRETFEPSYDNPGTRERTYLLDEYRGLVILTVALRAMVPIWGEFIRSTRREYGTKYKEYYAYKLLAYSSVVRSRAMEKLFEFVQHTLPPDKSKSSAIYDGLSTEDFPIWVLGLVLVRRLSVGDVRGVDPNINLVTFIFRYIQQKVKSHDQSFMGMVKDKMIEGVGQEGENNLSKLESWKVKEPVPAGDIEFIAFYTENMSWLKPNYYEVVDRDTLAVAQQYIEQMMAVQIWPSQITLTQWVMARFIPPRGLMHVSKQTTVKAMGAAQALLWHKGYHDVAALLSAVAEDNSDTLQLSGPETPMKIATPLMEQLDALYPYSKRSTTKQKALKRVNPAAEAIDAVAASFSERAWRLTTAPEWTERVTGNKNHRRYTVPRDIKIKLANLAISIAQRTF